MIRQIAETHKLLEAIKRLHEENTKSLKAEIARLEVELLEARKANTEIAKLAMDRYFEIKRLKREIENKKVYLLDDEGKPIKEFTLKGTLTLVKEKLEVGKWYHTDDFTVEKLKELLPIGTAIMVEKDVEYDNIGSKPPTKVELYTVKKITTRNWETDKPLVDVGETIAREWFKIVKED